MHPLNLISLLLAASFTIAQFPPKPEGISTKQLSHPGLSISWKETYICEPNARGWAGYVHMPSTYLADIQPATDTYNVSTFFWYIEARNNPQQAPTAIYFAGGPGESSLFGATGDGGPCTINSDSNSTTFNPFSMNEYVNMLYVDHPVGAGYSYDELIKSTSDLSYVLDDTTYTGNTPFDQYDVVPPENTTFKYGILPSSNPLHTANSTTIASRTMWHFSQAWFGHFPKWRTSDNRVSLW
jgi:hypothetical protein